MKSNVISHIYTSYMIFVLLALHSNTVHSAADERQIHPVQQYLETPAVQNHAETALAVARMYDCESNNSPQSFEDLNKIISDRTITSPDDRARAKLHMSNGYYHATDIPCRHGKVLKLLSRVISDKQISEYMRINAAILWNKFVTDVQTPYEVSAHAGEMRHYIHVVRPDIECLPTTSITRLSKPGRALEFPCAATSIASQPEQQSRPEKRSTPNNETDKQKQKAIKRHRS